MWLQALCSTSGALAIYHHAIYPLVLKALAKRAAPAPTVSVEIAADNAPSISLIVPAYNEARNIVAKIANIAALDYSNNRLRAIIVCDGCADGTAELARAAICQLGEEQDRFTLIVHDLNRGKVAILNETIASVDTDLIALTDTSARLPVDALTRGARHFARNSVGVVSGVYDPNGGDDRARIYWNYQTGIKAAEGALGSPIGVHGAFYMFRRAPWRLLEADTINDDVILPMRIIEMGYVGVYDQSIRVVETEVDKLGVDLRRRQRLAAGAIQQVARLWRLADPRRPGLAFSFLSGKGLRAFMPFLLLACFLSNIAIFETTPFWAASMAAQLAIYCIAAIGVFDKRLARLPGVGALSYLVAGHVVGLVGATRYLFSMNGSPWRRSDGTTIRAQESPFPRGSVAAGKRILDIIIASAAFVGLMILFMPLAIAIKLESRGPVFYRQLRVGLRTAKQSRLFYLTKFRTMRIDAEARTGAVWATADDPRITRVGRFLRKTRLDEIPQCIDVLRGEMSIVGPRPERPQFFNRLESEIPFYAERTYGLKPGITGLAQVTLPYDSSIEDVRAKVLHDHAYALRISEPGRWLVTDLAIILRTVGVMLGGKGR
ncbi:MAG: sugar transferase [Methylocystis sp.]